MVFCICHLKIYLLTNFHVILPSLTARCKGLLAAWAFLQVVKLQKNSSRCFAKKYSLTRMDPFISDDVCCYSRTRFKSLQNCSINWGKLVALITVHFQAPSKNVYPLANLAWKEVVFLANNFFTGPVGGVALVLRRLISHKTIRRLRILTILMQCRRHFTRFDILLSFCLI